MKKITYLFTTLFMSVLVSITYGQSISINATESCMLSTTTLVGSYYLGDTAVNSWLWDLNNDGVFGNPQDDATGKTAYYSFQTDGSNTVGLKIITKTGGTDSTTISVIVHPLPNVNFHVDNACEFQNAKYVSQSTIASGSITQYKWDFDNDGTVDDNTNDTAFYTVGPASTYVSKLTCVSDKGCESSATKTTEIFNIPSVNFTVTNACVNNNTSFSNTTTIKSGKISLSIWDLGDGAFAMSSGDTSHVYSTANSYTVRLIAISNNLCRDTLEKTVVINPSPSVSINASSNNGDSTYFIGDNISLTASGANNYSWSTGATTDNITVNKSGNYSVTGTDANSCVSTESMYLLFNPLSAVNVLNNILTPNEDGINDYLEVENIEQYDGCSILIYNRWNDEVFNSSDYNNDWNGTYQGNPLDAGTYYYIINCNNQEEVIGNINILR